MTSMVGIPGSHAEDGHLVHEGRHRSRSTAYSHSSKMTIAALYLTVPLQGAY